MNDDSTYPKGTKFQAWSITEETQRGKTRLVVRRWVTYEKGGRKCERLPAEMIEEYQGDKAALMRYVARELNAHLIKAREAKEKIAFKHAYIDEALLERYRLYRIDWTGGSQRVPTELVYLRTRVLNFFVGVLDLPNPKHWRKEEHQRAWWASLEDLAPATRRDVLNTANQFISWLRDKRGAEEVPEFKLKPISPKAFARQMADHQVEQAHADKNRTYIPEADLEVIKKKALDVGLYPHVMLGLCFGLRRSEILGIKQKDATAYGLHGERTLACLSPLKFATTKGARPRHIPYWYATQEQAAVWAKDVEAARMDPDTLTSKWAKLIEALKKEGALHRGYSIHDLRHTFITQAANQYNIVSVQEAAGHADIRTTMKYVHKIKSAA